MDDYASEAAQDDADTEVDEADMTVEQLAALYPEMSPEELNEYLETKRLLGSLRDQLAAKLGTVNEDAPLPSGEDEVSWALSELERLKQEYEAITAPDAEDSELEAILGAPQRAPKKTGTENLLDTVEALSDELEEAERESRENVAALKPVQYAKTRFALKKAPSQAMLEYLIALPPNTQRPSFTTDEGTRFLIVTCGPADCAFSDQDRRREAGASDCTCGRYKRASDAAAAPHDTRADRTASGAQARALCLARVLHHWRWAPCSCRRASACAAHDGGA